MTKQQGAIRKPQQIADFSWRPTDEPEEVVSFSRTMAWFIGVPLPVLLLLYYLFFWG